MAKVTPAQKALLAELVETGGLYISRSEWHPAVRRAIQERHAKCRPVYGEA